MRVALGAAVLSGCLAGLGAMSVQRSLALEQSNLADLANAARCYYCGVIERVREIDNAAPDYAVSTVAGSREEGILILLGALGGTKIAHERQRIFEATVLMNDGSIRAVRSGGVQHWKAGSRVKIVKGRIARIS